MKEKAMNSIKIRTTTESSNLFPVALHIEPGIRNKVADYGRNSKVILQVWWAKGEAYLEWRHRTNNTILSSVWDGYAAEFSVHPRITITQFRKLWELICPQLEIARGGWAPLCGCEGGDLKGRTDVQGRIALDHVHDIIEEANSQAEFGEPVSGLNWTEINEIMSRKA